MVGVGTLLFIVGVLALLGIASSKFSNRLGMPVLVLFLVVGMLAGSEGIGGLAFDNYALANILTSIALALILFDGGLRTEIASIKAVWKPALVLATLGVLITAVITGTAAAWLLGVPLLTGILLGGIVGSTDAAAVFAALRTSSVKLPDQLASTLEVESASNDPMAIFLTIGVIQIITGEASSVASLIPFFLMQFSIGALGGITVGLLGVWVINRINLETAGLYPVLATAVGILSFGITDVLGGSGFLAIYITGVVVGNGNIVFKRGIFIFNDAMAWLSQILLFVILGLLVFPSQLLSVAVDGLLISVVLIFVARPLAVLISVFPFGFKAKELLYLSWVGLKGAVPITLATFPLMAGIEGAALLFNVVFFSVLLSALTQGWSIPAVARYLGLAEPLPPEPPLSVEINSLRHVDGEVVEYIVAPSARVAGQALRDLALPDGVTITLVVRDFNVIVPRGATRLLKGDHVFVAMRKSLVPLINRLFDPMAATEPLEPGLSLLFHVDSTVGQLHRFFGIPGPTWSEERLGDLLEKPTPEEPYRLGPFLVLPSDEEDYLMLTYSPGIEDGEVVH